MKILLPGGAGYIGSHTAVELLNAGKEIVIIDNFSNSSPEVLDKIKEITDEKESRKNFYSIYYDSNYRTRNRYGCKCSRNRFNPRQRCSC